MLVFLFNELLGSVSSVNSELNLPLCFIYNMDILKEKNELVEMFGIHFESVYNLPPLASRILGNLILNCSGMTFENIIETTGASKSSVSTNLNLLLKFGKINYFTLHGDRKKYFRSAPFSERLDNYVKVIRFEKQIIDKMERYREKTACNEAELCDLETVKEYRTHVLELEQFLHKSIEKFREIESKRK